jgi:hypothetical protein
MRTFAFALAALVASCAAPSSILHSDAEERPAPAEATFVYEDLDAFAAAMARIDEGADAAAEMLGYTENASPAFRFFAGRFGATPESMLEEITRRPRYYRYLGTLKPELQAMEPGLRAAMRRLRETAPPGSAPVPFYFLVGNQTAGANPGFVDTPQGQMYFVAVAIDAMAMSPRVDMSEFARGAGGRVRLDDIPYVVIHEAVHVYQRQQQGLDNYRAIYTVEGRGTNLAYAIREGCADFLTELVSGHRLEQRESYVDGHERELWRSFAQVMLEAEDGASGWFGAPSEAHPDRPSQVGYGLGSRICRAYHDASPDKTSALLAIYGAHLAEHFEAIAAPYAARMAASGR